MTPLKRLATKIRRFTSIKEVKGDLKVILSLLILNILLAVFGGPFLSENIEAFLGKSRATILSDLLFLEGGMIFALGTFIVAGRELRKMRSLPKPLTEEVCYGEKSLEKRLRPEVHMIIVGASLLGLSIAIGVLLT